MASDGAGAVGTVNVMTRELWPRGAQCVCVRVIVHSGVFEEGVGFRYKLHRVKFGISSCVQRIYGFCSRDIGANSSNTLLDARVVRIVEYTVQLHHKKRSSTTRNCIPRCGIGIFVNSATVDLHMNSPTTKVRVSSASRQPQYLLMTIRFIILQNLCRTPTAPTCTISSITRISKSSARS